MKAAVVHDFAHPPRYDDFAEPELHPGDVTVHVAASAVSQLVRARAAGRHYSAATHLPFVPGIDGVGRLDDGGRVYFSFPRDPFGAMAERTAVAADYCVAVPDGLDDVTAAALANPGMSSWAALTERARFVAGESVLVNGATGVAGRLAIRIAKHLGARRVVATGRTAAHVASLAALGADAVIALDQPAEALVQAFRRELHEDGVDVVLDYLWGPSAEALIHAASGRGSGRAEPRLRFVQIGSIAGHTITMPAAPLRSSGLELLGSGLGSVSNAGLVQAIGAMLRAAVDGGFSVETVAVPLAEVGRAWATEGSARVVLTV